MQNVLINLDVGLLLIKDEQLLKNTIKSGIKSKEVLKKDLIVDQWNRTECLKKVVMVFACQ